MARATNLTDQLRAAADWMEAHPDIEVDSLSNEFGTSTLTLGRYGCDLEHLQQIPRALGGKWDKNVEEYVDLFTLSCEVAPGVTYRLVAARERVCERVVTGTREVEVPDDTVEDTRPLVTRTVEDVEWRCEPLLSREPAPAVADLSEVPF